MIFEVKLSKIVLNASGLILLHCCTKTDAEGISGDESNISISSFVKLLLSIPIMPRITVSNDSLRFLTKHLPGLRQNSSALSETFHYNKICFTRLGFICDLLVIKIYLITRAALATSKYNQ